MLMKMVFLSLLTLVSLSGFAQEDTTQVKKRQYPAVSVNFASGKILPTTDFVRGDNLSGAPITRYQAYSLKALWQNPGYRDWQKVYRCPYYGMGVTMGNFFNEAEIGHPVSVYGILGIPIKRWKKAELYSEFQFGLAVGWNHYDSITNPKNLVIGGGMTVHLNLGVNALFHLTRKLDAGVGVSFIHFSNGGFERPNRGFNIYAPSLEIKYHLNGHPEVKGVAQHSRLARSNDLYLMLGYGDHQLVTYEMSQYYYAVAGLSAFWSPQLSNAFRLGFGTDLNYWMGLTALADGSIGPRDFRNLTIGLAIQPEFIVGKLTLVGGIGIYAKHLQYGNFKQTYQRLGVRYEFIENISFGVNVRAVNYMLAEFLEFNLGYRFRWMR